VSLRADVSGAEKLDAVFDDFEVVLSGKLSGLGPYRYHVSRAQVVYQSHAFPAALYHSPNLTILSPFSPLVAPLVSNTSFARATTSPIL
jgi:hypothetical protein